MFIALSYAKMNHSAAEKYAAANVWDTRSRLRQPKWYLLTDEQPGDNCFILEDNTCSRSCGLATTSRSERNQHRTRRGDRRPLFVSSHVVISGRVHVGEYCFLGVNATIRTRSQLRRKRWSARRDHLADTEPKSVYGRRRTAKFPRPSAKVRFTGWIKRGAVRRRGASWPCRMPGSRSSMGCGREAHRVTSAPETNRDARASDAEPISPRRFLASERTPAIRSRARSQLLRQTA